MNTEALSRAHAATTPGWQQRDDQTTEGWITIIGNVDGEYHPDGSTSCTYDVVCVCEDEYGERLPNVSANAHFIALAHKEVPALIDRIEALEAENARLRETGGALLWRSANFMAGALRVSGTGEWREFRAALGEQS